jgi:hypothetical protein
LIEYKKFAVVKYFTFGERKKHTIKAWYALHPFMLDFEII